jgi:hypothetical protein
MAIATQAIDDACKGWGTDEDKLLKALAALTPEDRAKVAVRFQSVKDKSLKAVVKKETGTRDFGTALQYLSVPLDEAECDMIKKACKGVGTDERLLYPIIAGRTNQDMTALKRKYFNLNDKDLGKKLDSELGGAFEALIFNCLQAAEEEFDSDYHNSDKVDEDTKAFHAMGEGKFGTDETGFFKLLCASPSEHLKAVNQSYAEKYDVTLFKAIDDELAGKVRDAAMFVLGMKLKPYETVAKFLHTATKGMGTDEDLLTCTIVRYQAHLSGIMEAYIELYGKTLQDTLDREVRGDFKKVLIELCNGSA